MNKILLLNGPNLALLGVREPHLYGKATLTDLVSAVRAEAERRGFELLDYQSDSEGDLVGRLGAALADGTGGILINAAAYTHSSIALRDAIAAVKLPAVEIHLSNTAAREEFRHRSLLAPVCLGVVAGFGADSYLLALAALINHLEKREFD